VIYTHTHIYIYIERERERERKRENIDMKVEREYIYIYTIQAQAYDQITIRETTNLPVSFVAQWYSTYSSMCVLLNINNYKLPKYKSSSKQRMNYLQLDCEHRFQCRERGT
tara:strand:+ start:287 stop:619 length:333 start_codon:yes stop_codon:yes gene_type:complete